MEMRHKELLTKKEEAKAQPPPEVYNGPVSKAFCLSVNNKKVDMCEYLKP